MKDKILLLGLMGLFVTRVAFAGMSFEDYLWMQGEEAVIRETGWDVIVAVITKVVNQDTTNGNPPIAELNIEECLRGDLKPGSYMAVWEPFPHDVDYVDANSEARIKAWEANPLSGPAEKAKMILVGNFDKEKNKFMVSSLGRFEYSEERKSWVLENIKARQDIKQKEKTITK